MDNETKFDTAELDLDAILNEFHDAGDPQLPEDNALLLEAHLDTLGGMVTQISGNRLKLTNLGGMNANNGEAENVRIYTREGKVYTGTFQLKNASVHVNGDYSTWAFSPVTSSASIPVPWSPPPVISRADSWTISCLWVSSWHSPSAWQTAS